MELCGGALLWCRKPASDAETQDMLDKLVTKYETQAVAR